LKPIRIESRPPLPKDILKQIIVIKEAVNGIGKLPADGSADFLVITTNLKDFNRTHGNIRLLIFHSS